MYGSGTEADVITHCGHGKDPLEFTLTVTDEGARSDHPVAASLREWNPIPTAEDRGKPHMLDGM